MSRGPGFPGMPPGMNPQMMQQLAARMQQRGGRPGMPQGMPPGMMPGMMPGGPPQAANKEQYNPLPDGKGAMQILKAHAGCVMPREAASLNALLSKSQEIILAPGREKELYEAMAKAITLIFRSDHECERQLATRTAGLFNEEPELKELSDKIIALDAELTEMKRVFDEKRDELNKLAEKRWESSVKLFGLNIQERFYRIDEEARKIEQLDLRCDSCNGVQMLREARQDLARILLAIEGDAQGVKVEAPANEEVPGGFPPPNQEKTDGADSRDEGHDAQGAGQPDRDAVPPPPVDGEGA